MRSITILRITWDETDDWVNELFMEGKSVHSNDHIHRSEWCPPVTWLNTLTWPMTRVWSDEWHFWQFLRPPTMNLVIVVGEGGRYPPNGRWPLLWFSNPSLECQVLWRLDWLKSDFCWFMSWWFSELVLVAHSATLVSTCTTVLVYGNQARSDSWSWRSGVRAKKRCKDPVSEASLRLAAGQLMDIALPS